MKLVIQLFLWVAIIVLGYLIFNSIYDPIQFNDLKEERYAKVIDRLENIRDAELAYREVTGRFAGDFDELIEFVDTAQFTLTQRRDTTIFDQEYFETYGVDQYIETVVIDTLGFASIKDSLFKNVNYENMMEVPIEGVDENFQLEAGTITKNENKIPVFEAKIAKEVILYDQDPVLVSNEKQRVSVDQVNGPFISVGSMEEINTSGNWPTQYGDEENN